MSRTSLFPQPFGEFDAGDLVLDAVRRDRLFHQIEEWKSMGWFVALGAGSEGEIERFQELATEQDFDVSGLTFLHLPITRGFIFPSGPASRAFRRRVVWPLVLAATTSPRPETREADGDSCSHRLH